MQIPSLDEINRALAKKSYLEYVKYTNADFKELRHSVFLCNLIDEALKKRESMLNGDIPIENQYVMISMSPRHGKSMTVTETLPSYFMGKYPRSKTILTAYSLTLANDFARVNSRKMGEHNVFGVKVLTDNQDRTEINNGSICVKAGILGGITGKGANLLIIDDPIKTAEEARSEVHRAKIWKEWESSLSTRFEPPAIVILIMTRWHEDDLAGRLMNLEYGVPLPWKVINIPLEAEANDVLGRSIGEPLWPERYGYNFIIERKRYPQSFNALYQGRPSSEEGNMIKRQWWQYYDVLPKIVNKILSVDAAFTDTKDSAKVSIQVWGKTEAYYYMIDNVTARMDFITTLQAIRNILSKHPDMWYKYIEEKANGAAIINVLNREIGGFIGVKADVSTGGKEARVQAVTPWIQSGNVFIPKNADWTHDFVEECASFPNGKYKDQVDAMSQGLKELIYAYGALPQENKVDRLNMFADNSNQGNGYLDW